jgi:hypothetical protein
MASTVDFVTQLQGIEEGCKPKKGRLDDYFTWFRALAELAPDLDLANRATKLALEEHGYDPQCSQVRVAIASFKSLSNKWEQLLHSLNECCVPNKGPFKAGWLWRESQWRKGRRRFNAPKRTWQPLKKST